MLLNLCAVFRLQWVKNKNSFKVKQRKQNVGFVPLKLSTLIWSHCLKTHKKGKWGKYIIFKCKQWIPSNNELMVGTVIIDGCGGIDTNMINDSGAEYTTALPTHPEE